VPGVKQCLVTVLHKKTNRQAAKATWASSVPYNFIFLYRMTWVKYNLYQGTYLPYNHPLHAFNIKTMMKNGLSTLGTVTGHIRLNTIRKLVYFKENLV